MFEGKITKIEYVTFTSNIITCSICGEETSYESSSGEINPAHLPDDCVIIHKGHCPQNGCYYLSKPRALKDRSHFTL